MKSGSVSTIRSIRIKGRNTAADRLTIDYKFGGPLSVNGDVTFDGGTDVGDTLRLIGNAYEVFIYAPSGTVVRNGKFVVYNQNVNFTAIENTFATNFNTLTVEPQGSADVLSAALGVGYLNAVATRITGTTDARAITPITFDNLDTLTIDTGIKDKLLAASNDVVTLAAGSLEAERLRVLNIRLGKGNDKLVVNSRDLGLPVST